MTRTDAHTQSKDVHPAHRVPARAAITGPARALIALMAALALLAALAVPALAAEEPTGSYTHPTTATQKVEPTKTTTTPKQETAPSKESTTPKEATEPSKTSTTPTTTTPKATTTPAKQGTLPFTGLNLTWVVVLGLVLVCAGGSIVLVQRRQQRGGIGR